MDLGGIELTWLGHAAIRLRFDDGTVVLVDPWLSGNPACPDDEKIQDRIDAIYVTHGHFDHLGDTAALAKESQAPVFAIHEVAEYLMGKGVENVVGSNKGGTVAGVAGIMATMTDAVHSAGISGDGGIVAGGEAGGWVLDIDGGPTIYHAGDTTIFGDMSLIREISAPDIALLPIGGHFTMGPEVAARSARLLGVETVLPIHYGTFPILAGTPAELQEASSGAFEVVVPEIGVGVT